MQLKKIGRPRQRLWLLIGDRKITFNLVGETMFIDDETTDDHVVADVRNFSKVELWTRDAAHGYQKIRRTGWSGWR